MPAADATCEKNTMALDVSPGHVSSGSMRQELERHRLEHRARRLRLVVAALRERVAAAAAHGPVPPGLHRALADFSSELAQVRARLSGGDGT
jgi:hypothetical protein